ncbi:hypothetical protein MNV49_001826 [Pseudohyphozyma bogoriensis]|nr:hypothetical protein MNV49_001826 [Pseudohyphozyma bogoriensis]
MRGRPKRTTKKVKQYGDGDEGSPAPSDEGGQQADATQQRDELEEESVEVGNGEGKKDDENGYDEEDEPVIKKKKATPKKSNTKGAGGKKGAAAPRRARLSVFVNLPLDVVCEILGHLDVQTLLALTRTSQVFRSILVAPSGKGLWKAARERVMLPDLTATDLTEWAYASLVYERSCHCCQKKNAPTVDYCLRGRGCKACMKKNSLRQGKIKFGYHPKTLECVPSSLWMDMEFYWVPTVRHVSSLLYAASKDVPADGGESEFDQLVSERKKIVQCAKADGAKLQFWERTDLNRRKAEEGDLIIKRKEQLEERMRELGYTDQDFSSYAWTSHSLVNQPRELTDRIWNTVRPKLTAVLDDAKGRNGPALPFRPFKFDTFDAFETFM